MGKALRAHLRIGENFNDVRQPPHVTLAHDVARDGRGKEDRGLVGVHIPVLMIHVGHDFGYVGGNAQGCPCPEK
ncbi:MAG: hypothetical protein LBR94_04565 [Desulfovibrio sp.]|nr:hypothetical protein [Desulfovibrio sp.]